MKVESGFMNSRVLSIEAPFFLPVKDSERTPMALFKSGVSAEFRALFLFG